MGSPKVLVIDDETDFRDTVRRGLEREGYAVRTAASGADGLARLQEEPYDLVIVDLYMPAMTGLRFLELLQGAGIDRPPAIMISGLGDWRSYGQAMDLGAKAFLTKPVGIAELVREVGRVLTDPPSAAAHSIPRHGAQAQKGLGRT